MLAFADFVIEGGVQVSAQRYINYWIVCIDRLYSLLILIFFYKDLLKDKLYNVLITF